MTVGTVYDAILGSGVFIRQCQALDYSPNLQAIGGRYSGQPSRVNVYGGPADPRGIISTGDIAGVLAAMGTAAGTGLITSTITLPLRIRDEGALFKSGANHYALTCGRGMAFPRAFAASQDDEAAMAAFEAVLLSADGSNPTSHSVTAALAAQAFQAQYGLGPVIVNGAQVPTITAVQIDTGIAIELRRWDGLNWPQAAYIAVQDPAITIQFDSLSALASFGTAYGSISSLSSYFRKRDAGGEFVANNVAEHCAFSLAGGLISYDRVSAEGLNAGGAALRFTGTTLTGSSASTIPL